MYQFKGLEDTIVAVSTATGQGAIGIVRLSGTDAVAIAEKMFVCKNKKKLSELTTFTTHYGIIVKPSGHGDEEIDEALMTLMKGPKSYTKEDIVEFSCHGGVVVVKSVLMLALDLGARLAEPGEFTKRAFINGRIDLAQAEAVMDVIHSKTESFLKVSNHQLKGELSTKLESMRKELMDFYIEIEAIINFPEDDIDASSKEKLIAQLESVKNHVETLLETSEHGKILKEGIKVVLCGKANVGKSSLLNALLKQPRAIVTDIEGTTRDTIEETAQINGIPFQLVDTAGILKPRDSIEKEAIKRSEMYIKGADLTLLVLDASRKLSKQDHQLIENTKDSNVLVVINKTDLSEKIEIDQVKEIFKGRKIIETSVLKENGIDQLQDAIVENVWHGRVIDTDGIMVSNIRHIKALKDAIGALKKGGSLLSDGLSLEFISEEIKSAINFLDSITGRNIDHDLLDKIFSEFCIGK